LGQSAVETFRQRAGAQGVAEHRDLVIVGRHNEAQVAAGLGVVEDPPAAEDQQVELAQGLGDPFPGDRTPAHRIDAGVGGAGMVGVAGKHQNLRVGAAPAQVVQQAGQDRLIAEVRPAVRAENPDHRGVFHCHHRILGVEHCRG
jgi:hypothetical protein